MRLLNERSSVAIAAALCIVISLARRAESLKSGSENNEEEQANEIGAAGAKKEPQFQFDLGAFVVNGYYNHTEYVDKLRISKTHLKYIIGTKLDGPRVAPLSSFKATQVIELVRCENLTLSKPELLPSIECLPLAEQIRSYGDNVSPSVASSRSPGNYVRRHSYRQKSSSFNGRSKRSDFLGYPLADSVVQHAIDTVLAEHNMPEGVGQNVLNFGFYVEMKPASGGSCSGKIFFSLNADLPPGVEKSLEHWLPADFLELFSGVYREGMLVTTKEFGCSAEMPGVLFSGVNIDFTFIKRKQFPYITCRHTMMATPLGAIWQYDGKIQQVRDENTSGEAYNTTITVRSLSGLFDSALMNFQLEQTFENKDFQNGHELMILATKHFAARVDGLWTPVSLIKILSVDFPEKDSTGEPILDAKQKEGIIVTYADKNDEYLDLTLKVRRDIVSGLFGSFFDSVLPNSKEDHSTVPETRDEL